MAADDPIDTVSGTLGLTGCADTILVLARASGRATIYCRGRDIEEAEHAATFDPETCRWTVLEMQPTFIVQRNGSVWLRHWPMAR